MRIYEMLKVLTEFVGLIVGDVTLIHNAKDVVTIKDFGMRDLKFIHFWGTSHDPVYLFWCLREMGVLADGCCMVISNIEEENYKPLTDLQDVYGGMRFGSLFLMRYRKSTRPGVRPSQCGMYME